MQCGLFGMSFSRAGLGLALMDKIAILGAGNIGEALIAGLVGSGVSPQAIVATTRSVERRQTLAETYGVAVEEDNRTAVADADAVVVCVKPAQVADVLAHIGEELDRADELPVIISMAAGVTLASLEEAVPAAGVPLVRVMPNTPMLVGNGVLAVTFGRYVSEEQRDAVRTLLAAGGLVVEVQEAHMDAVTALSGSGPAYFFLVAEALVDAGVALGLSRELATELVTATAAGAGVMLANGGSPIELRAQVSSPAGTTVAAIRELEESGLRGAFYRATSACARRAQELDSDEQPSQT